MIGIDIIEVERIKRALKQASFKTRVFTPGEIAYAEKYKNKEAHLAGFYTAKEAVMKALEDCKQISFLDIEILHKQNGAPFIELRGNAKEVFEKMGKKNLEISISQTNKTATAVCIIN